MKKEDAEIKAKALGKDLVGKEAEHKGSKRKCIIASVEAVESIKDKKDPIAAGFEVHCFFSPIENRMGEKKLQEEIDYFLGTYKILDILNTKAKSVSKF